MALGRYIVLCAAALAAACGSAGTLTAVTDIRGAKWQSPAQVTFTLADSTARLDAGIFLRCNRRFQEDSLTVRIALFTPDSLRIEEPLVLTVEPGTTPTPLRREITAAYRRGIRLRRTGEYRMTLTPCRPVKGVEAVGISIEKK